MKLGINVHSKNPDIVYVLACYGAATSGVYKKVARQVNEWKKQGEKVTLIVESDRESVSFWHQIDTEAVVVCNTNVFGKWWHRFRIVEIALKFKPKTIYLRDIFPIWIPKSDTKVILEVQSSFAREIQMRSRLKAWFFQVIRRFHYRNINGVVYVTEELQKLNELSFQADIPTTVISNGFDTQFTSTLDLPSQLESIGFLFVGHPNQAWHGLDLIEKLAGSLKECKFYVVGSKLETNTPNLLSFSALSEREYRMIAQECSVGIGPLAHHRIGMTEACPLKVREYLSMGLPVAIRHVDPDLKSNHDFVFSIPIDDEPIESFASDLFEFALKWVGRRVEHTKLLPWNYQAKELKRIRFLKSFES